VTVVHFIVAHFHPKVSRAGSRLDVYGQVPFGAAQCVKGCAVYRDRSIKTNKMINR
jgi:hypothetical protein